MIHTDNLQPKPYQILGFKPEPSLLKRHVSWLKSSESSLIKIVAVVEAIFVALLCLPLAIKGFLISHQLDAEKKFQVYVSKLAPPDANIQIELHSSTQTFTHTHEIIIENDILWVRKRYSKSAWSPIYFEGFAKNVKPVAIHADGANLMVLDENRNVYYKKLIAEYRNTEIKDKKLIRQIKQSNIDLEKNPYIAIDMTKENNWIYRWFTLPLISRISKLFKWNPKLQLPDGFRAVAISHRGRYNNFLEDAIGARHPVEEGVTTIYALDRTGKTIFKYDPWSPRFAKMNIHVPETATTSFEAINLSAAGSHLMLLGYESTKNPNDTGVLKRLTIKTKLADIDSEGWNPGLKYSYFPSKNPKVRVIGKSHWRDHALDLKPSERVSKNISIHQLGEGNDAREIRIEGWNSSGLKGYFYKKVDGNQWQFKQMALHTTDAVLPTQIINRNEQFKSSVTNYKADNVPFKSTTANVRLSNFGEGSTDSLLEISTPNKTYNFILHRKKTLRNFLGLSKDSFDCYTRDSASGLWQRVKTLCKSILGGDNALKLQIGDLQVILTAE